MLGQIDPKRREVTVVGAGIAGLLMAEALDRVGFEVTLLEASERAGGLIATAMTPWGPAEAAAHSIQATPAVLALCRELGVELVEVRANSRARYIWRRGNLRRFPLTILEAFRTFFRAYSVLADRSLDPEKQTLEQWARRFLGEPALKFLLTPFLRGIYGARPSEIEVGMAFPGLVVPHGHSLLSFQLRKFRQRLFSKSPRRHRPKMMAPLGGMGALTTALENRLIARLGARFKRGIRVSALPVAGNLVLCVPAESAREILADAGQSTLSDALKKVTYSPLVSVTAFVEKLAFGSPPRGVGVLLPEGTGRKTLGILFNSSSFPGRVQVNDAQKTVSLTLMLGGSSYPEVLSASDSELSDVVRQDLEAILDLAPGARIDIRIHRWKQAVPQYNETLRLAWQAAIATWCAEPGRVLFGNYTGQVSIRGMIEATQEMAAGLLTIGMK